MIAVLASMVVQIVELSVPYIWSLALDPVLRVVIRKIDVMQTLTACQLHQFHIARDLQASQGENHHQTQPLPFG